MTSSFLNVEVNGSRQALLAGGWNQRALNDSALFVSQSLHWKFFDPAPLPYPLRSGQASCSSTKLNQC
jgi:hypothetical protein